MLAIALRFPAGRYHATPWDRHVNEGAVEWPPSPWRLLRALVATRHLKARDEVPEDVLKRLVEVLASELPRYALPSAAHGGHTRHYMPLFAGKTTKVFDTFVHLPPDERIVVAWPSLELEPSLRDALGCLLTRLGYLGRAEAWVEACLCDDVEDVRFDCGPISDDSAEDADLIRLLAPIGPEEMVHWRASTLDERLTRLLADKRRRAEEKGKDPGSAKLTPKDKAAAARTLPGSVYDALVVETDVMRKEGWSRPPGSRWIEYALPTYQPRPRARVQMMTRALPTVARFALAGQVLPRLTDAVVEAEKLRVALLSHSGRAPVFTGRDPDTGSILTGHRHAFVLPEANGRHGHITHVTLFARMGFDDDARAALERLRSLWQRSGHDLQLVLIGVGQPEDFAGLRTDVGQCPLLASSTTWISRTPFVPTRHDKERRRDESGLVVGSPEHDAIRLLQEQGLPRPERIERVPSTNLGGKPTRWLSFRTERKKGNGRRGPVHGVGFRLRFAHPVSGPIAIGYGAHFGLGVFLPEHSD
ncbi:MAG: type I-U CRISPR-associated protein Cas5/Cas6 [Sandaracinaceae bacterium]|nr:type I-U CRISPR-associated protein Cas5/Cas6 [Sandaracinaceae bacterium]